MFEQVLGRVGRIRVRVRRRENGEKKEKEERKVMRTGSVFFYIDPWTGSDQTRSTFLHFQPLDLGVGGSELIQRL